MYYEITHLTVINVYLSSGAGSRKGDKMILVINIFIEVSKLRQIYYHFTFSNKLC